MRRNRPGRRQNGVCTPHSALILHVERESFGDPDFARLLRFVEHADLHPVIDSVVSGLDAAPEAFARMIAGDMFGKIVIEL